jgi:hypothetical protein
MEHLVINYKKFNLGLAIFVNIIYNVFYKVLINAQILARNAMNFCLIFSRRTVCNERRVANHYKPIINCSYISFFLSVIVIFRLLTYQFFHYSNIVRSLTSLALLVIDNPWLPNILIHFSA